MRDCPTVAARGRETKQVPYNVLDGGSQKVETHFYAVRSRGSKPNNDNDADKF